ncbi:Flagellar motor switch protein FliG [Roseovarius sp. EC-HK134]|uniref:Flagellar motor switch protein FliG n=1 Tax=Roseovarius mucosus TaxID=215743 RepID=A0A1V0RSA8_9RHOB|nr:MULTISPECIES: flagellar motor switch protein FliG [Roseovarius]ARE84649.1 flagellar motor switch protein FliG [Roseovarius mucosus]VVT20433.1 Flagellar motor switch protein FliG [Roseovarius sp. EC-SD190]VVT20551.1 Flagellar motor switch protein FliG [Roseovarius sp. EC-HK134]
MTLALPAPSGTRPGADLTPVQKAAILMMIFGEETAAQILRALSPSEVQVLGEAMFTVQGVDHDTVDAVLNEFLGLVSNQTGIGIGAGNYVRQVLDQALGAHKAQSVLSRIVPSNSERPIEILDWMDPSAVAELIQDEHPQIMALVIASLDYAQGAEVLKLLPPEAQPEIIRRIATLNTVQPEALRDLEEVMRAKFKANTTLRASQIGGVKAAARIMNFTRQDMEERIMKDIRKDDKSLSEDIQDNLFVFDYLIKSDERALQTVLREIDSEILILALKGSNPTLRDKLLGCVSARAAANIMDEMEAMGPVRLSQVQEAQKQVITVARRLSDEGKITLAGRGGEKMV